jgi:hypothetical protein
MTEWILASGTRFDGKGENRDKGLAFIESLFLRRSVRRKSGVTLTKLTRIRKVREKNGETFFAVGDVDLNVHRSNCE